MHGLRLLKTDKTYTRLKWCSVHSQQEKRACRTQPLAMSRLFMANGSISSWHGSVAESTLLHAAEKGPQPLPCSVGNTESWGHVWEPLTCMWLTSSKKVLHVRSTEVTETYWLCCEFVSHNSVSSLASMFCTEHKVVKKHTGSVRLCLDLFLTKFLTCLSPWFSSPQSSWVALKHSTSDHTSLFNPPVPHYLAENKSHSC